MWREEGEASWMKEEGPGKGFIREGLIKLPSLAPGGLFFYSKFSFFCSF